MVLCVSGLSTIGVVDRRITMQNPNPNREECGEIVSKYHREEIILVFMVCSL
jgi:hypothetical protein